MPYLFLTLVDLLIKYSCFFFQDRKEFFERYKNKMKKKRLDQDSEKDNMDSTKMLSKKTSEKKISVKSIYFFITLCYHDSNKQKGVMKRQLPGPRIAKFTSTMNYAEFVSSLKDMFFSEDDVVGQLAIANSCGIPFDVKSEDWTLQEFV